MQSAVAVAPEKAKSTKPPSETQLSLRAGRNAVGDSAPADNSGMPKRRNLLSQLTGA